MSETFYDALIRFAIALLELVIVFGLYCLTGWLALNVYNAIALAYDLPLLNYWVFVGGCYVIHWVVTPHKSSLTED